MLEQKLQPFIDRLGEIDQELSIPQIANDIERMTKLAKEKSDIEPVVQLAKAYLQTIENIRQNKLLLTDKEIGDLAKEELKNLEVKLLQLENDIKLALLPKDPNDDKNIFLEIRAGTGGDEAALFVADLVSVYIRYVQNNGWKLELIDLSHSAQGGYKEAVVLIKGEKVFSKLKFEGGTHRVQRVPATESQGRIHTSAVTVAVMPEASETEVCINPNDLEIDVMRAGGNGGQSVNTTDSAVRITHIPTGIVVVNQNEKSQHKNKATALKVLKAKILEIEMVKKAQEEGKLRNEQVGTGDRSGRIRTYNYPQNRLTDHRYGITSYALNEIMQDGKLDLVIDPAIMAAQAQMVQESGL